MRWPGRWPASSPRLLTSGSTWLESAWPVCAGGGNQIPYSKGCLRPAGAAFARIAATTQLRLGDLLVSRRRRRIHGVEPGIWLRLGSVVIVQERWPPCADMLAGGPMPARQRSGVSRQSPAKRWPPAYAPSRPVRSFELPATRLPQRACLEAMGPAAVPSGARLPEPARRRFSMNGRNGLLLPAHDGRATPAAPLPSPA